MPFSRIRMVRVRLILTTARRRRFIKCVSPELLPQTVTVKIGQCLFHPVLTKCKRMCSVQSVSPVTKQVIPGVDRQPLGEAISQILVCSDVSDRYDSCCDGSRVRRDRRWSFTMHDPRVILPGQCKRGWTRERYVSRLSIACTMGKRTR